MNLISWIKKNKLASLLIIILCFFLLKNKYPQKFTAKVATSPAYIAEQNAAVSRGIGGLGAIPLPESAPQVDVKERLTVEESYLSMVVKDVRKSVEEVTQKVVAKGGYLVSSNISQPQEAPFATVVFRLPNPELRPTLEEIRKLGVKVTSENLVGWDVTDQYVDLEARLATLEKTKAKYEAILNQAQKVEDIMSVQTQLTYLQDQIDSFKGRQDYLKKTAENSKLVVYLSSDEFSLPYAPQEPSFRPKVIFKQAVRSLVLTLRALASLGIWIAVFSLIWVPALLGYKYFRKRFKKH